MTQQADSKPADVIVRGNATGFLQEVVSGNHHLRADEPVSVGGTYAAPGPYDYLLIALGVCTSMTVGLYARRRQLPLENITVSLRHSRIHAEDCEECETKQGMLDRIDTEIELTGLLTAEQRAKLVEIAGNRVIRGGNNLADGPVNEKTKFAAMKRVAAQGFAHKTT